MIHCIQPLRSSQEHVSNERGDPDLCFPLGTNLQDAATTVSSAGCLVVKFTIWGKGAWGKRTINQAGKHDAGISKIWNGAWDSGSDSDVPADAWGWNGQEWSQVARDKEQEAQNLVQC